jgi:hypothetical protein
MIGSEEYPDQIREGTEHRPHSVLELAIPGFLAGFIYVLRNSAHSV